VPETRNQLASLRRRGSLTLWFTDEAIQTWRAEPRTTPGGQRHYSALAISTALTMGLVFGLALRQTEGLIGSVIGLLGLDLAVPDHSTLSRRAKTLEVPPLRRLGTGRLHLLVDGTGLKLGGAGEWLVEKHGTSLRRSWRKLHIGFDAASGEIVAVTVTRKDIDDAAMAEALLDQIADPIASFTADGAYDQDQVTQAVAERHPDAAVIVPPRAGAVGERFSRNRSDTARPSSADDRRSRADGLAKSQRLQPAGQGRGVDRAIQTGSVANFLDRHATPEDMTGFILPANRIAEPDAPRLSSATGPSESCA
jgi:IS5 family transposase